MGGKLGESYMNRDRAWRRNKNHLKEVKVFRKIQSFESSTDVVESRLENMRRAKLLRDHLKSCSCFMCGNPRKHWNEKTLQEKIFKDIEKSQD